MRKAKLTDDGRERLPDFIRFGKHMVKSRDIDPLYPILQEVIAANKMDDEEAYWFCFLYVAWYNLPVGYRAWLEYPMPNNELVTELDPSWPTGIERRANRGGKVAMHIAAYLVAIEGTQQIDWYHHSLPHAGSLQELTLEQCNENWLALNHQLQTLWGNGRWAGYKHCEVLRRVMGVPVIAPDMGNQFSSGPREGLAMFYGEIEGQKKEVIEELDRQGLRLQAICHRNGLMVDIEELETLLCNWKSLMKGKYYVGHDIDENQEQIEVAREKGIIEDEDVRACGINRRTGLYPPEDLYAARWGAIPEHYLGEHSGWHGVQKHRMAMYRDHGKIVGRKP